MFDPDLFAYLTPRTDRTVDHILVDVHVPRSNPKPVVLHLKFCGRGTQFFNEWIEAKPLSDRDAATRRAIGWLARYGIVGWSNVEKDGNPVPYSTEVGAELLDLIVRANRTEKINAAIDHAMNPDAFCDGPALEAGELGKG